MGVTQSVNLYAKLDRSGPKFGALAWIGAATLATVTGYGVLAGFAFLKANDLSDAAGSAARKMWRLSIAWRNCGMIRTRYRTWRFSATSTKPVKNVR